MTVDQVEDGAAAPRATRQRTALLGLLGEVDGFLTAQQLHAVLQQRAARVGLATVYRTLGILAQAGEVDVLVGVDGDTRYRRCGTGHHHHLVCRNCGLTVEEAAPQVEEWAQQVASRHGFTEVSHTVEVFGLCPQCADTP